MIIPCNLYSKCQIERIQVPYKLFKNYVSYDSLSSIDRTPWRRRREAPSFIEECKQITYTPYKNSFASRLQGLSQPLLSKKSPPYICREYGLYPLGLQFLQELAIISRNRANAASASKSLVPAASPIDFLPTSPSHVGQCNSLLQQLFWPGFNIGDSLSYKAGIVALYRKLVVGVGIITPDGYLMYVAVCPHWEGEGLGRMMLWWSVKRMKLSISHYMSPLTILRWYCLSHPFCLIETR